MNNTDSVIRDYVLRVIEENGWQVSKQAVSERLVYTALRRERRIALVNNLVTLYEGDKPVSTIPLIEVLDNPLFHYFVK